MNQVVKDKMQREVMVISNHKLFSDVQRDTKFYPNSESNLEEKILENYEYMVRWEAELNFDYKQPISYAIVINEQNRIFVYKRWWSGSNAWEQRLHNKIAFWVWWHIEKEDKYLANPISDSLVREIEEELNLKQEDIKSIEAIWYINNEMDEVSKVHIWVVYVVKVHDTDVELLDWELDNWEFVTLSTLEWMIISWNYDVEWWSKILFEPLKNYLEQ